MSIRHRDQWYPGEHKGIVPRDLWEKVQAQLNGNLRTRRKRAREQAARQAVNLTYDNDIHFLGFDVFQQTLQCRPLQVPAGVPAIVVAGGDDAPAFLALAQNEGF